MKTIGLSSSFIVFFVLTTFSQNRILVFHETNNFRHSSIDAGITMFEDLGNENGDWITDNSQDSSVFNDANLAQYDIVVFLNTSGTDESGSGGDLLSSSEKLAFENFIAGGKGFIGIHAATDTYRDGIWPFYNELVGGIIQNSPNHTSNDYNADLEVINSHPIIDFLGAVGSVWNKDEEYYYWELNGGQLSADNTVLLEVEQTGNETYDAPRPMTWYKESITFDDDSDPITPDATLSGFRSFYTALGHNSSDYDSNSNFRTLIKNATLWAIDDNLSVTEDNMETIKIFPNPVDKIVSINIPISSSETFVHIYNSLGKFMFEKKVSDSSEIDSTFKLNVQSLQAGTYFVKMISIGRQAQFRFIKK